jgi:hypothetical protein
MTWMLLLAALMTATSMQALNVGSIEIWDWLQAPPQRVVNLEDWTQLTELPRSALLLHAISTTTRCIRRGTCWRKFRT